VVPADTAERAIAVLEPVVDWRYDWSISSLEPSLYRECRFQRENRSRLPGYDNIENGLHENEIENAEP